MTKRNTLLRSVTVATIAATLMIAAAIIGRERVWAFNPQPDPPAFAMLGITHGQSARLNVADTNEVQPGPCRIIEMTFLDGDGNQLMQSSQCLMPGHAVFLDLNGITLGSAAPRTEVRAKVHVIEPPGDPDRNRTRVVASLEVFDNETGRTSVVLTPPPDPDKK